jgi:hypothetical protein
LYINNFYLCLNGSWIVYLSRNDAMVFELYFCGEDYNKTIKIKKLALVIALLYQKNFIKW